MKRVAIDTNTINRILDTPNALDEIQTAAERGVLIIISSHVLRDELEKTRDDDRRSRLLTTYDALPRKEVSTIGGIYGISKYGAARYGDGHETGISLAEARTKGRGSGRDALIATTAAGEADVLVTDDNDLKKKIEASAAKCEVWGFEAFLSFLRGEKK